MMRCVLLNFHESTRQAFSGGACGTRHEPPRLHDPLFFFQSVAKNLGVWLPAPGVQAENPCKEPPSKKRRLQFPADQQDFALRQEMEEATMIETHWYDSLILVVKYGDGRLEVRLGAVCLL